MRVLPALLLFAAIGAARGDGGAPSADATGPAELGPSVVPTTVPAAGAPADPRVPVVPSQALVEKVGHGDRLFLAGDLRNALFAYQDAVYMEPRYAPARVRLGRAYLALRYPAQAMAQAEAALAVDPGLAEAARLLEDASRPPAIQAAAPAARPAPGAAPSVGEAPVTPRRRVYRLLSEPDAAGGPRPDPAPPGAAVGTAERR